MPASQDARLSCVDDFIACFNKSQCSRRYNSAAGSEPQQAVADATLPFRLVSGGDKSMSPDNWKGPSKRGEFPEDPM